MASRATGRRVAVVIATLFALLAFALIWGPGLWDRYGDRVFASDRCTAEVGGEAHQLTAEQADNAALIVAVGLSRGLSGSATTIALATAFQESDLRNVEFGDRDSLGLFQQRPSQGWGTPEQVTDRHYATNAFFDALLKVEGWEEMSVSEAAQAVQRSAFPNAYTDHEAEAELWSAALRGEAGAEGVTCSLDGAKIPTEAEALFEARLRADFDSRVTMSAEEPVGGVLTVRIWGSDRVPLAAVAAWSVAVAAPMGIETTALCPLTWGRADSTWSATLDGPPCTAEVVVVTLGGG